MKRTIAFLTLLAEPRQRDYPRPRPGVNRRGGRPDSASPGIRRVLLSARLGKADVAHTGNIQAESLDVVLLVPDEGEYPVRM
jgi:hypothetical protein